MLHKLLSEEEDTYEIANEEEGERLHRWGSLNYTALSVGRVTRCLDMHNWEYQKDGLNGSTTYFAVLSVIPDRPRGAICVH